VAFQVFLLRALMLGAFYPNLLRGLHTARGTGAADYRTLIMKRPPEKLRWERVWLHAPVLRMCGNKKEVV
jgi:hypothetical protein